MPEADSQRLTAEPPRRSSRNLLILFTILGVSTVWLVAASAIRSSHHHYGEDALHGDSDEAMGALTVQLEHMPPSQHKAALLQYVASDEPGLRYAATDGLGQQHGADVVAALENSFRDSSYMVRSRAMEVLPDVDRDQGLLMELAALRDDDTWIREAAIQHMSASAGRDGSFVDRRAVPGLIRALDDGDPIVEITATSVLHRVTGEPWRVRTTAPKDERRRLMAAWKSWWAKTAPTWNLPPEFVNVQAVTPTRTDPAPDFSLTDIDGQHIDLKSQAGKITLLNFFGTWCAPCRVELPDLLSIDKSFKSRGLDIIGVAVSEHDGDAGLKKWRQDHNVTYRLAQANTDIQESYGHVHEVPVSVLIDAQGRIRYRWDGERDAATFSAAIQRLMREQDAGR
jgi:peroxiredoxin